ncbi:hypothetical protein H5410_029899, partial [Solanum commersonii]
LLPSHIDTCIALKLQCFVSFWTFCLPFQFLFPSLFLQSLSCSHLHLFSSLFINPLCKLQTTKILRFRQFFGKTLRDLVHLVESYVFHTLKMLSSTINKLLFLLSSFKGV